MTEDLSKYHQPLTNLFPCLADVSPEFQLTQDQIAFYHTKGYLSGLPILDEAQVEALRAELNELASADHPGRELFYEYNSNESTDPATVLFHALGAWRVSPAFHDLLWHPAFLIPAAQLLGGPVRFWHDQIFYKPARHGGIVAWHQDYSYWTRTQPMQHLSCWIGLDDSTAANGCVQYVPGSHLWNLLPITGLAHDMAAIEAVLTEEQRANFKPVAIELKKGEASFHHPLMVHGSYANSTPRPRRATVINVFRDGVLSAANSAPLEGVPIIPLGEKMQGQFFPLLFNTANPSARS